MGLSDEQGPLVDKGRFFRAGCLFRKCRARSGAVGSALRLREDESGNNRPGRLSFRTSARAQAELLVQLLLLNSSPVSGPLFLGDAVNVSP